MKFNDLPKIDLINGKPIAIIYRNSPTSQTEPCPFCGASHAISGEDALYSARCIPMHKKGMGTNLVDPKEQITWEGMTALRSDGFLLRTVGIEDSMFK